MNKEYDRVNVALNTCLILATVCALGFSVGRWHGVAIAVACMMLGASAEHIGTDYIDKHGK